MFVDYIAEHLNIGGRAGIIVPEGIIFQSQNSYKELRKMLVENTFMQLCHCQPERLILIAE